jgi:hypothetical protein
MTLTTAIFLNGILDLGIVLAVAAIMWVPFTLDRPKQRDAAVGTLASPLPLDLAA